ncbi:hypothetical protein [Promicromonospora panici]|uniref:hypothetical protein n=1 Tax=Promicromonospora panici TaxID=2219658 RepID=UPI00101BFD36|nr:hypothetical protein [Promicromonospora panici]
MAASNTDDRDDDVPGDTPRELGDDDVASRWADIVATLGDIDVSRADDRAGDPAKPAESSQTSRPDDESAAADPASERASGRPSDPAADPAADEPETESRVIMPTGPRDWPLSPEAEALEEEESHFTPPEPPPLLSRDPLLTMAWSFVVGVPVLAVVGVVVSAAVPALSIPPLVGQIGLGLFVAGLAVLIWRMPHQRDPDDDGPGAVV